MAGLIAIYDVTTHYYLCVTRHEELGRCIKLIAMDKGEYSEPAGSGIALQNNGLVYLRVKFSGATLQFFYSSDGESWSAIGPNLDATVLSDEHCNGFTGTFTGFCAQDLSGRRLHADFDWFKFCNTDNAAR